MRSPVSTVITVIIVAAACGAMSQTVDVCGASGSLTECQSLANSGCVPLYFSTCSGSNLYIGCRSARVCRPVRTRMCADYFPPTDTVSAAVTNVKGHVAFNCSAAALETLRIRVNSTAAPETCCPTSCVYNDVQHQVGDKWIEQTGCTGTSEQCCPVCTCNANGMVRCMNRTAITAEGCDGTKKVVGCMPEGQMCTQALTCGVSPAAVPYKFTSGCMPAGFTTKDYASCCNASSPCLAHILPPCPVSCSAYGFDVQRLLLVPDAQIACTTPGDVCGDKLGNGATCGTRGIWVLVAKAPPTTDCPVCADVPTTCPIKCDPPSVCVMAVIDGYVRAKCACPNGYIRNTDGQCVPPPQPCPGCTYGTCIARLPEIAINETTGTFPIRSLCKCWSGFTGVNCTEKLPEPPTGCDPVCDPPKVCRPRFMGIPLTSRINVSAVVYECVCPNFWTDGYDRLTAALHPCSVCPAGYRGQDCELPPDPDDGDDDRCANVTCPENAVCQVLSRPAIPLPIRYPICICAPGFVRTPITTVTGDVFRCIPRNMSCAPDSCSDPNARCVIGASGPRCLCPYPLVLLDGACVNVCKEACPPTQICVIKREYSSGVITVNPVCICPRGLVMNNSNVCVCPPGMTGSRCQAPIADPCFKFPCPLNRECVSDLSGRPRCICKPNLMGENCHTDLCSGIQCPLGSRCFHGRCVCMAGFHMDAGVCKPIHPHVPIQNITRHRMLISAECLATGVTIKTATSATGADLLEFSVVPTPAGLRMKIVRNAIEFGATLAAVYQKVGNATQNVTALAAWELTTPCENSTDSDGRVYMKFTFCSKPRAVCTSFLSGPDGIAVDDIFVSPNSMKVSVALNMAPEDFVSVDAQVCLRVLLAYPSGTGASSVQSNGMLALLLQKISTSTGVGSMYFNLGGFLGYSESGMQISFNAATGAVDACFVASSPDQVLWDPVLAADNTGLAAEAPAGSASHSSRRTSSASMAHAWVALLGLLALLL